MTDMYDKMMHEPSQCPYWPKASRKVWQEAWEAASRRAARLSEDRERSIREELQSHSGGQVPELVAQTNRVIDALKRYRAQVILMTGARSSTMLIEMAERDLEPGDLEEVRS